MLSIFIVSDGTGQTAEQLVRAALVQFDGQDVQLHARPDVRAVAQVQAVVTEAADRNALIVHTLVSNQLRAVMLSECRQRSVDSLDLLGPMLDRLTVHLQTPPQERPGLFHQLAESRRREIEAVDFAFRHDDGRNSGDLDRAEIVLVGVSRSMKTPTMLYLAYRGWFAVNVPLVPELAVPESVTSLPPERVFYLEMSPERLIELRRVRAERERIPLHYYTAREQVEREIAHGRQVSRRHGWRHVDVTGKGVEEVAREIISMLPHAHDTQADN